MTAPPSPTPPPRTGSFARERLIGAAFGVFAREGYSGAAMEAVADAAGLSRAALYKHFASKDALFLAVAAALHEEAAAAAYELADRDLAARRSGRDSLIDALLARHAAFTRRLDASAHAEELVEESGRRAGALARAHTQTFLAGMTARIEAFAQAGLLPLRPAYTPAGLARMLNAAAAGLKSGEAGEDAAGYEAAFREIAGALIDGVVVQEASGER